MSPPIAPTVVLLHGLGRTTRSMQLLVDGAKAHGFGTINLGYQSRAAAIAALAASVARDVQALAPTAPLHFGTHSLGAFCCESQWPMDSCRVHRAGATSLSCRIRTRS